MSKELADRLENLAVHLKGTVYLHPEHVTALGEAVAALRSEPVAWMPIETAPKNHFPILVSGPYGQLVAFRDVTWAWWPFPASEALDYKPTHWMPLPAAPSREDRTDRQEPTFYCPACERDVTSPCYSPDCATPECDQWPTTEQDADELLREARDTLTHCTHDAIAVQIIKRIDAHLSRKEQ